jgi:hypothetical protein
MEQGLGRLTHKHVRKDPLSVSSEFLVPEDSPGRPLTSIVRLKAQWQLEYEPWQHHRLDGLEVVYI